MADIVFCEIVKFITDNFINHNLVRAPKIDVKQQVDLSDFEMISTNTVEHPHATRVTKDPDGSTRITYLRQDGTKYKESVTRCGILIANYRYDVSGNLID